MHSLASSCENMLRLSRTSAAANGLWDGRDNLSMNAALVGDEAMQFTNVLTFDSELSNVYHSRFVFTLP